MTDSRLSAINAAAYLRKAEWRKERAKEPFEKKLQAVVRLQRMRYELAKSAGRPCAKPWHTKGG